jgi:hypothetical protein
MRKEAAIVLSVLSFVLIMIVAADIVFSFQSIKTLPDPITRLMDMIVVALIGIITNTRKDPPEPDQVTTTATTTAVTNAPPEQP